MPKKTISKLDSYALMIIALSALFVSIWQVNLQRKHDRIAVMPYLDWVKEKDAEGFTRLNLKNKGFGPAVFQKGDIVLEDSAFKDWKKALAYLDSSIDVKQHVTFGAFTLLPGEDITLVTAKGGKEVIQIKFQVQFKNVYDDEFADDYSHSGYPFR